MRSTVDPQKIEQLMKALGREAHGTGSIYFTGGASALLMGWRSSTVDIDIRLDSEPPGIFQAIAKLKMYAQKLFSLEKLRDCFESIESELIRFPALEPELLKNKIEQFIELCQSKSERNQ
jgi:hypothetical protein